LSQAWLAAELLEATILNAATKHFLFARFQKKHTYLGGAIFFMKK
jgi:hypothetical protein